MNARRVAFGFNFLSHSPSDGSGRTGTFCAVNIALERVKLDGTIDMFQTVRRLRTQRPLMVQTAVRTSLYRRPSITTNLHSMINYLKRVLLSSFHFSLRADVSYFSYTNITPTVSKQYHCIVLLSSFHLNGHTLGFHPQTQKLEPPCTA